MKVRARRQAHEIMHGFVRVSCVWGVLLASSIRDVPIWIAFAICVGLGVSSRPRFGNRPYLQLALGGVSGACGLGLALHVVAAVGLALGLPAPGTPTPPIAAGTWLAIGVLAPVFEEIVYRGRLLEDLARWLGAGYAILITSALFALPHANIWAVPACFALGLLLAVVRLCGGSLALVIGCHAGLNAAGLGSVSLPGFGRLVLHPLPGAVALLVAGFWLCARARGRKSESAGLPASSRLAVSR